MEFEPLKNYESQYMINRNGEIKTIKRRGTDEIIIKDCICKNGYKSVSLYKEGKGITYTIHRLLAKQYLDNPNNHRVVDHIDRNKLNNSLDNLRWCSYSINNSNIEHNGSIYIDKRIINGKEYKYYRVQYKDEKRKRFKTLEEAQNYLNKLKE